jgi:hypothetical protein
VLWSVLPLLTILEVFKSNLKPSLQTLSSQALTAHPNTRHKETPNNTLPTRFKQRACGLPLDRHIRKDVAVFPSVFFNAYLA